MKKLILPLLALGFALSSCETHRPPDYFLEAIHVLEIPNFSQDANENGVDAKPDIYIELVDELGNVLSNTPYFLNADTSDFPLSLVFDNPLLMHEQVYFIDVYDFDESIHGQPEFLGSVEFNGKTNGITKYVQYNDTELSGTLGVTIDTYVEYYD